MFNIRWIIASALYFIICFILLLVFHFKFSGFMGFIALIVLGLGSHALVDFYLNKIFKKKKGGSTHV